MKNTAPLVHVLGLLRHGERGRSAAAPVATVVRVTRPSARPSRRGLASEPAHRCRVASPQTVALPRRPWPAWLRPTVWSTLVAMISGGAGLAMGQSGASTPVAVQVQVPAPAPAAVSLPLTSAPAVAGQALSASQPPPPKAKSKAPPKTPSQSTASAAAPNRSAVTEGELAPAPAVADAKRAGASLKETSPRQRADALYARALQQLQEARGSDARQSLYDALAQDPRHGDARLLCAALLIEDRQLARAETLLSDGLQAAPQAALISTLARLKVERGEEAAALALLLAHEDKAQDDAAFQAFSAALLMRAQRPGEAVERYRRALRLSPGPSAWWAGLGLALAELSGQDAEAVRTLRQALVLGDLPPPLRDRVEQRLAALPRGESLR